MDTVRRLGFLLVFSALCSSVIFLAVLATKAQESFVVYYEANKVADIKATQTLTWTPTFTLYLPLVQVKKECYLWSGQVTLQDAVYQHTCVEVAEGIWTTNAQITMWSGHSLIGKGQNLTVIRAIEPWVGNGGYGNEAVVHDNGSMGVVIANLTIDANNLSTLGIGAHGITTTVNHVTVMNAKCDGITIRGTGWRIWDSTIENNGHHCPNGLPAAGLYVTKPWENNSPTFYSPVIEGNVIRYNGGPGLDVDRVWGGTFKNNNVYDNGAWAAVSLGGSYWTLESNTIRHPASTDPTHPNHLRCEGGSAGRYSAALALCQDNGFEDQAITHNVILNNQISGWYGIRLIGNDEAYLYWVPRFNVISGNDVYGSHVGCVDDFQPGQWSSGENTWNNNNCRGTPNTPPDYF